MYSSIRIQGYRGLDTFRLEGLGRLNLLVGPNNSGKTSILECIELLRSAGESHVLWSIAGRRGEWGLANEEHDRVPPGPRREILDVSHLFANRELNGTIEIEADLGTDDHPAGWNDKVTMWVEATSSSPNDESEAEDSGENFVLRVEWSEGADVKAFVTENRFTEDGFLFGPPRPARTRNGSSRGVQFVRTSRMTPRDVVRAFSKFVLTPRHEIIRQALRIVEPKVEDLAPIADYRTRFSREAPGGVVLRLSGVEDRVPIGSMGDGMWHMLGLALSIADADGGVLLIDEIDTGLHYSVMEAMWRMLSKAASARSIQVFATTHSRDCYESLAAVAQGDGVDVTIQRIDSSRGEAVTFSREAIVAAAERNIEVR
ncbi:AAA family ATPase [Candidatus Palauibacter sp.]|uniref:AAA family ATPase n=1 Tax=Candidatus Palauibacter sp. TaxID=3101350 RepID=UPI003B51EEC1